MSDRANKSNSGYTIYKPTGVTHCYPHIDLLKREVIGTVSYKGKIYMEVTLNLKENTIKVIGSVRELGDLSMDEKSYIDMFKYQAKYFVDNNISDPKLDS
ncbi:hypothetical protein ACQCVB_17410 [Fictibacillus phosphorivorans]|uniref:hypothetical protein n=1 Tax=Fictibacillus phosphorivorans TaxID=1221500 RepID=UPI003CFA7F11